MDAEASSDAGGTDQLGQEFRLLGLQFRKLVRNDEQVGHGLRKAARAVQTLIIINVHRAGVRDALCFVQHALASFQLRVDRNERTLDRRTVKVGDRADDVREVNAQPVVVERARKAAALIVDQQKGHFVGGEVDGKRQDVSDQELRFARAGRTGDQAVRALALLMQVEHERLAVRSDADRDRKGLDGIVFGPSAKRSEVLDPSDVEHLQEGNGFGKQKACLDRADLDVRGLVQRDGKEVFLAAVQLEGLGLVLGVLDKGRAVPLAGDIEYLCALLGKLGEGRYDRNADRLVLLEDVFDRFGYFKQLPVQCKDDVIGSVLQDLLDVARFFDVFLDLVREIGSDPRRFRNVGSQEADRSRVVPHVQLETEVLEYAHILFAAQQDDLDFVVTVRHDDLCHHIPHEGQNVASVADHAADEIVDQGRHDRRVVQLGRVFDDLLHALFQRVLLDRKALRGALERREHRIISVADADLQKIVVHVPAFPETSLGIRPMHDLADGGVGVAEDTLFLLALLLDLLHLGFEIGRVLFLALLFIFVALFFGIALRQERHQKARRSHQIVPHKKRVSAHQGGAPHAEKEGDLVPAHGRRRTVKNDGLRFQRLTLSGKAVEILGRRRFCVREGENDILARRDRTHIGRCDLHTVVSVVDRDELESDDDLQTHDEDVVSAGERRFPDQPAVDEHAVRAVRILDVPSVFVPEQHGVMSGDIVALDTDPAIVGAADGNGPRPLDQIVVADPGLCVDVFGIQKIAVDVPEEVDERRADQGDLFRPAIGASDARTANGIPVIAFFLDLKDDFLTVVVADLVDAVGIVRDPQLTQQSVA